MYIYTWPRSLFYYVRWMCVRTRTGTRVRTRRCTGATVSQWPKVANTRGVTSVCAASSRCSAHVQLGYRSLCARGTRCKATRAVNENNCSEARERENCRALLRAFLCGCTFVEPPGERTWRGGRYNRPFFSRYGGINAFRLREGKIFKSRTIVPSIGDHSPIGILRFVGDIKTKSDSNSGKFYSLSQRIIRHYVRYFICKLSRHSPFIYG